MVEGHKKLIAVLLISTFIISSLACIFYSREKFLAKFNESRKGCYLFVPEGPLQSGSIDTQNIGPASVALHPSSFQIKLYFIMPSSFKPTRLLKIGANFSIEASSNEIILKLRNKIQHIPLSIPPNKVNTLTMRFMGIPFNSITLHFNNYLMYSKTFGYNFISYPNRIDYYQDLDNLQIKGIEFCKFFDDETKLID